MTFLIYRAPNGVPYPGLLLRIAISGIVLAFLYFMTPNGIPEGIELGKPETMWILLLVVTLLQEWALRVHLWGINKFHEPDDFLKYIALQFGAGVLVPSLLLMWIYGESNAIFLRANPFFFTETITLMNAIYLIFYYMYTIKYRPHILVSIGGEVESFRVMDIVYFAKTGKQTLVHHKNGRLFYCIENKDIKKLMSGLDPRHFKLLSDRMILNMKFKDFESLSKFRDNSDKVQKEAAAIVAEYYSNKN